MVRPARSFAAHPRGRRCATLAAGVVGVALALASPVAAAAEGEDQPDNRPWGKGMMMPSLGLGASFGSQLDIISIGAGFSYFVLPGLAVGLSLSDTVYVYRAQYKRDFPGIDKTSPTNVLGLLPTLQYVFYRSFRFSPYVIGGLGPVFYNHKRGTVGQWMVGTGALIGLGGPVALQLGVSFFADFPDSKWKKAFSYAGMSTQGCAIVSKPCSFNIAPRLGLVFYFGAPTNGGGGRRRRAAPPSMPPIESSPPPEPEPTPAEAPPPDPAAVEVPPAEPPPVDQTTAPPPVEPPPDETAPPDPGAVPDPTTPPAEAPPPVDPATAPPPVQTPSAAAPPPAG